MNRPHKTVHKSGPWEVSVVNASVVDALLPKNEPVQYVFTGCELRVDNFLLRRMAQDANLIFTTCEHSYSQSKFSRAGARAGAP